MTHSPDHAERVATSLAHELFFPFQAGSGEGIADVVQRVTPLIAAALRGREQGEEEPIVPPVNGETDPEWAAIRRAIDQFAGRVPTISKHRALHNTQLAAVVARLDAAGDREAADTIVWQCWFRALDWERERFLLEDARAALHDSKEAGE